MLTIFTSGGKYMSVLSCQELEAISKANTKLPDSAAYSDVLDR